MSKNIANMDFEEKEEDGGQLLAKALINAMVSCLIIKVRFLT